MTTDPKSSSGWLPFQVAFVYAVFGVLWISLSDALVARLAPSQRALVYIQTYKGWFFVAVTALLVFGLVRTHVSKIRRAQEILKSREDLLRQGLEGAQEGVWSWNIRTGELVVDERVVRALGYEVGELAPSPETWDRLLHPEDAERARTALAAFQAGETTYYHMEYRIQRKDGEWQWISSHGKVVERGPAGEPLRATGTIRDIAERKKAELALRESELRLRGVLNYAPVIVFALDKDGVFTFSEGRGLDSLGLRPGELVGQSAFEVYQDNPGIVEHIRMALAGRAFRSTVDVGFISFEVRYAPLRDASGQVEGTIGVALDVSERKRAAEILENVELEKATILDSITDHVCLLDRSLNVLWPNQAACAFAGLPREELIGRPWREAWPKAWPPSEESPVEIAMATERTCEKTFEAADGRVWHVHGYPVRNASGNVVSGLELARDISDQRRAEEEQSRLESHLRRVQRMEAIGTLAGGIAHDFNNALAAIFGYTEIAAEELPEDSPLRGDLARVTVAAERARDLIQQILAFSRGDEQERQLMAPAPLIKETLKLLRSALPSTIQVEADIDPESGLAMIDPTQVHQVVVNLCTNAFHAMRENGGRLRVSLKPIVVDTAMAAKSPALHPGPYIELCVSDTGHGMDEATLEQIFDPFFTTKKRGEGTGLGLAVVHGVVARHGGDISVSSRVGEGTTFRVWLPKAEEEPAPAGNGTGAIVGGNERILIVDDEQLLVTLLEKRLRKLGYRVTSSVSSTQASQLFAQDPNAFDLVISDVTMPHMRGDQLAESIRQIRPGQPVILLTGFSEAITSQRVAEVGAHTVLNKPVDTATLAAAVRDALDNAVVET